jgi:hypothetical protein
VAARCKAWVCDSLLTGITGSNPSGGMAAYLCCVLSRQGLCVGLINRPTECGVSECDREVSTVRWPWPTRGCRAIKNFKIFYIERFAYINKIIIKMID